MGCVPEPPHDRTPGHSRGFALAPVLALSPDEATSGRSSPRAWREPGESTTYWGCSGARFRASMRRLVPNVARQMDSPVSRVRHPCPVFLYVPVSGRACWRCHLAPGPDPSARTCPVPRRSLSTSLMVAVLTSGNARSTSRRRNASGAWCRTYSRTRSCLLPVIHRQRRRAVGSCGGEHGLAAPALVGNDQILIGLEVASASTGVVEQEPVQV